MEVKTTVSSNLQIAATNSEAAFANSLGQNVKALLEPVSTINGVDYYYTLTDHVLGNGDASDELSYEDYAVTGLGTTGVDTTKYKNAFNKNYGVEKTNTAATWSDDGTGAVAYCDYTFYLKAVNTTASDLDIKLTKMNLLYNGNNVTTDKAWTAAIFVHDTTAGTAYSTAWADSDVITMNKMSGATNFTANKAIGEVSSTVGLNDLDYGSSASTYGASGVLASVDENTTAYYKVTVRLWLEGEDTSCTTTIYNNKTDGYTLDLRFEMDTTTAAVTAISSDNTLA
ncbi:MAG: hypothetical protein J5851_09265 [Oscillospiraceae bacterium]|nr:hypothetical protein [Oscillospiraceae bacterium]